MAGIGIGAVVFLAFQSAVGYYVYRITKDDTLFMPVFSASLVIIGGIAASFVLGTILIPILIESLAILIHHMLKNTDKENPVEAAG